MFFIHLYISSQMPLLSIELYSLWMSEACKNTMCIRIKAPLDALHAFLASLSQLYTSQISLQTRRIHLVRGCDLCACMYAYTCVCESFVCICIHIYAYIMYVHVSMHIQIQTHTTCIQTCACMCVLAYAHVYVHMFVFRLYMQTYHYMT
jgi:hypothetical protein